VTANAVVGPYAIADVPDNSNMPKITFTSDGGYVVCFKNVAAGNYAYCQKFDDDDVPFD